MSKLFSLFLASLFVLTTYQISAQRIDSWQDKKENDLFIEGTYALPVSSAIQLISFHSVFEPFELGEEETLFFEVNAPKKSDRFLLQVQERRITEYYMLESKPSTIKKGFNKIGPWNTDDYVASKNISSSDLAVVFQLNEDELDHIVPVSVSSDSGKASSDEYHALFRLSKTIGKGTFKIYKGKHEGKLPKEEKIQTSKVGMHRSGAILQLSIDKTPLEGYTGWLTAHLSYSPKNSMKKFPYTFYFYHTAE